MEKEESVQPIPLNVALDPSTWVADLDPAGRRRFWLLLKIVGDGHSIDEALDAAQKVERFLRADGLTAQAAPRNAAAWDVAALPGVPSPIPSQALGGSRRRLLDPATKESFALEAARNNDNRHLAKTFNLTVRQAHAIRVSLSRRIGEIRGHGVIGNGHAPQAAGAPKRVSTATVAQLTARSAGRRAAQAPTAADLQAQRAV